MSLPFRTRLRLMGRATGGSGTPGGSAGQIQTNDGAGGFAGLASTGTGNAVRASGATLTNPVVGTQSPGDNSTKAASTAYVDTALAGVVQVLEGEVATFADLPAAAAGNTGHSYLVRQSTGVLFVNRKKAGIYTSDGAAWTLDGDATEAYFQDTLAWSNITSKPDAASQAEMEAGSEAAIRLMSPLRVFQAIAAKLTLGTWISGATDKTTPVDADTIPISDSAASNVLKKLTWANLKATAKAYFDTLYLATVAPGTSGNVLTSNGSAWTSAAPTGGGGTDIFTFGTLEVLGVFGGSTLLSNLPYRSSAVGSGTLTQYVGNDFSALEIRTGTTSGWGHYWFYSANSGTYNIYDLDETHTWKMQFLIRTGADITDFRLIVGAVAVAGTATPVDGIGVRFDTSLGDSNFRLVAWASSTPTLGSDNLGAVAANTVYTVKIWSTGDGTIRATVNGGTESTLTTGITSVRVNPIFQLINSGAADKRAQLARFALRIEGLSP